MSDTINKEPGDGIYGLIGEHLGHSYSPQIHAMLGDYEYRLFEMPEAEVGDFLARREFSAVNVTIPYKKTVMPFLDRIDDAAVKIGSVNTIVREADGTLSGYNTDYYGFSYMLRKAGIALRGANAVVLGSGGASATVTAVCRDAGVNKLTVVSRSGHPDYSELDTCADATVLINTTPVGMYPGNLRSPVSLDLFPRLEGVADLIYNPARTKLILDAADRGIRRVSGLYMLAAQGKRAAEYFFRKEFPDDIIDKTVRKLSRDLTNVALIGMPGSGKSSVGKKLAGMTGREFVDTDEEIIKRAGMTIPEYFKLYGESAFRDLESEVLEDVGKRGGLVIATGGGIVTRERNRDALRQNSTVIFIERDLDALPTAGRPVSQSTDLNELYKKRLPLYRRFADATIKNDTTVEETAEKIVSFLTASL